MAETNSTLTQYPRSSTTPELWIPYIMIGVSCVTFLAVHFWCYHKRNRQRYLRKRDEKRVKSGLMERRRITTLMLARYQSDLGISHSETDLHLSQDVLFYENTTDVCFDEQDVNKDIATKRRHSFQQAVVMAENNTPDPTKVPLPEVTVPTEPKTLEPSEPQDSISPTVKTVSTSQTWPRVSQSKTKPYNAHEISPNANRESDPYSTAITKQVHSHFDNTSRYLKHNEYPQGSLYASPFDPTIQVIPENGSHFGTVYSNVHSITPPPAYKTCIPPVTYPNVFYTSLTSPYNTKSPLGISSKSKHKKRRYDGKLIEGSELSDKNHGPPGPSSSNDVGEEKTVKASDAVGESSHLYAISNRGDASNMGYMYPSSDHHFCPITTTEETNYVRNREEAFPFAGPGQAYGSIRSHSARENQEMIPLQEIRRDHTQSVLGAGQEQNHASCSGVSHHQHEHDRPMFVLPYAAAGKSNPDITAVEMDLKSQPHPALHNHRNVIIAMPERSRQNFVSRTPGKVRVAGAGAGTGAGKFPPTTLQTMLKPSNIARMDTFDYSSSDQEGDSIASDMSNPETIPEVQQKSSQKPGYIQSNTQGITAHDIPAHRGLQNQSESDAEHIKDRSNVAKDATQDGSPETVQSDDEDFSKPKLQTPSLRSLDPHLVFHHHSKRKMTTKANEEK